MPLSSGKTPKILGESPSMLELGESPSTFKLGESPTLKLGESPTLHIDKSDEHTVTEVAEANELCHLNNSGINKLSVISDKLTTETNICSNNNPSSSSTPYQQDLIQSNALTKHKKHVKESIESKREKKAAKTLAIITGIESF